MKIFDLNNFWDTLQTSVLENKTVKAIRQDPNINKEHTANILGDDSGVLFSNRFIYDSATHDVLVKKINELKGEIKTKLNKTNFGKKLEAYQAAADSIKEQVVSGKTSKPKIDKQVKHMSENEEEDLMKEIEKETEEVGGSKNTSKSPGKSYPSTSTSDVKKLAAELSDSIVAFCNSAKRFAQSSLEEIEKAIEQLDSYRGDTLGETYRRIIVPKDGPLRTEMEEAYIAVGKILDDADFQRAVAGNPSYSLLHKTFLTSSDLTKKAQEPDSIVSKPDFLELQTGADEFAKIIFSYMAQIVNTKGDFTGKMGKFQITEDGVNGFIINGENVSRNSLDDKYEEFVDMLIRASLSDKISKYFKALLSREDFGSELNKYICLQFMKLATSDIKRQNLDNVYAAIDKEFAGTDFVNLFKNLVKNLDIYTPSIEHVENERVTVDQDAAIQIYESHGEYYVTLYFGSMPPETFSLERIGNRGYSNSVIKGLSTNRNDTLQDVYKKIMTINIKNEHISNRLNDPSQSKYKNSKYFNDIMREINEETKMRSSAKSKYFNIIKRTSQFNGAQGHPNYDDDPLAKFTLSVNYRGQVSLFVDFNKVSDSAFRITAVNYVSGDRNLGAMLINLLNNKSGNYDFDTSHIKDLSSITEAKRREIYRNITSFYTKYLTRLVDEIGAIPSTVQPQPQAPEKKQISQQKQYSKEELIAIYDEFDALSDKNKRTPDEEKRLAELSAIVSANLSFLREHFNADSGYDLDQFEDTVGDSDKIIKTLPKYEQNKMLRQLDTLYDQLDASKSDKDRARIQAEIDTMNKYLIQHGDFSDYRGVHDDIDSIADNLLNLSITDVDPANKTREAAIAILKNHPSREEFKENARENLDKYPYLKSYLEHIYSPEFVRLVYAN